MAPRLPGTPPPAKIIIRCVVKWPGISRRAISLRTGLDAGTVTRTVDMLIRKGILYLRLVEDPNHDNYRFKGLYWYPREDEEC